MLLHYEIGEPVFAILVNRLVSSFICEQGLMRTGEERVSAGLVSATDAAIHTTQMQVDEVTVIRLSPIVYNKELMKRELLDLIKPSFPSLPRAIDIKKYKKQRQKDGEKKQMESIHLSESALCAHMLRYIFLGSGRTYSLTTGDKS